MADDELKYYMNKQLQETISSANGRNIEKAPLSAVIKMMNDKQQQNQSTLRNILEK